MSLKTKKILGIDVTISFEQENLEEIQKYLQQSTINNQQSTIKRINPFIIFTPNPEIINYAQKNDYFKHIVNTAQISIPDGAGVVWAMRRLHNAKVDRIAGIDFMEKLVNLAAKQRLTIGLIGGKASLAVDTLECLRKNHPKLTGWVMDGPQLEITNDKLQMTNKLKITNKEIIKKIIKEKTSIVFVGFGFPKQEYFIEKLKYQISNIKYDRPLVLMAVGGSFDYISGRVSRAPKFMRDWGLEWLFRLVVQPWRLPRQLAGAEFFVRVLSGQT